MRSTTKSGARCAWGPRGMGRAAVLSLGLLFLPAASLCAQSAVHSGVPEVPSPPGQAPEEQIRKFEQMTRQHPDSPELWSNLGVSRAMAGDCRNALPALARAHSLKPDLYSPWFFEGYCYFTFHKDQAALMSVERALRLNPRDPNAWFLKAQISHDLGDLPGSLAALGRAQSLGGARPDSLYLAGKVCTSLAAGFYARVMRPASQHELYSLLLGGERDAAMGVLDSAIEQYHAALKLEPDRPDLLFALASACLEAGKFAEAEDASRRCLRLAPGSNWARLRLALALAEESQQEEASQLFRSVSRGNLELSSEYEDYLACAYLLNFSSEAEKALAAARAKFPKDASWNAWAQRLTPGGKLSSQEKPGQLKLESLTGVGLSFRFYLTAGRKEADCFKLQFSSADEYSNFRSEFLGGRWMAAAERLAPMLGTSRQDPDAAAAFARGDILQSLSYGFYKQLAEEFPDSYPAMQLSAENYQAAGQADKALEIYRGILAQDGPSPDVLRQIARLEWTEHRWDEALKALEPLARMDPYDATIFVNLGRIYSFERKPEPAEKAFRRAIQLEPRLSEAHLGLAEVLRQGGDLPSALRELKLAIQSDPGNARTHYVLSQVYGKLGEKELAAEEMASFRRLGAVEKAEARRQNDSLVPLD